MKFKNDSTLTKSKVLKKQIINIFETVTTVEEYKSYFEISLPIYLDNSFRINLFLDKNRNVLYNNLYTVLENSISKTLGKHKNIIKEFLENEKEFSEIKETLLDFGIDSQSLTLEYRIKDNEDEIEQILIYSEMIKKYYNNLYNIILYRLESNKNKKYIYYENFSKIITEFRGRNKFEKIEHNGVSNSPIYSNQNTVVAASKDFDALAQFYIDLEDLGDLFKNKKGILFCNNYKENDKTTLLKDKIKKRNIDIVALENGKDKDKLREEIKNNLKINGKN